MTFILMLLGGARSIFGAVLSWLSKRSMAELACIALAVALVWQTVRIEGVGIWPLRIGGLKPALASAQTALTNEKLGRAADRKAYEDAQKAAAAKNIAHVKQIESQQEAITNEVKSDLNSRLERLRRELRDNPVAKGSAGGTGVPKSGPTPCRADDPAWLCLSPADRLRAVENEERHDQLITWSLKQSQMIH